MGFEPMISCVKGKRPRPLDERSMKFGALDRTFTSNILQHLGAFLLARPKNRSITDRGVFGISDETRTRIDHLERMVSYSN